MRKEQINKILVVGDDVRSNLFLDAIFKPYQSEIIHAETGVEAVMPWKVFRE